MKKQAERHNKNLMDVTVVLAREFEYQMQHPVRAKIRAVASKLKSLVHRK